MSTRLTAAACDKLVRETSQRAPKVYSFQTFKLKIKVLIMLNSHCAVKGDVAVSLALNTDPLHCGFRSPCKFNDMQSISGRLSLPMRKAFA